MRNSFYTPFDEQILGSRRPDPAPPRSEFERDRDRVIHSYAFRRLQAKTQVFKAGEYDFYRTRLTHTIEVSQIGRSICAFLNRSSANRLREEEFYVDPHLVEAICLAHDLGHPPFGHAGERILNKLMDQFGGFEGNAQTLRLLTETIWHARPGREGMSPTRAFIDGVLKYKTTRSCAGTENQFVYDKQEEYINLVHLGLPEGFRNHKSIECQIMDWADDIAYSMGDFVDGAHARFITAEGLDKWKSKWRHEKLVDSLIEALSEDELSNFAARKIGDFIRACDLVDSGLPQTERTNRYRFGLAVSNNGRAEQKCLSQISKDLVFAHPAVQQLEYKAQGMIEQLFGILRETISLGLRRSVYSVRI